MTRPRATRLAGADRTALALTAILSLVYGAVALGIAARAPLWMDEVLAVWTARQPGLGAIWDAVRQGSEFSPPLYHLVLHAIIAAGGDQPALLRLPSILAVYGVGLCAFVMVRRRASLAVACLALAACLSGILFDYAIQARQYALVAACFSLALVLRDIPDEARATWRRGAAITGLLALAVGMHFYAVLLAAAVGLMELLGTLRHRRLRLPFLTAPALAGLSILLWLPIMRAASAYNQGDSAAPAYYAKPTLASLVGSYVEVLAGNGPILASPLAMLFAAVVAGLLARRTEPDRSDRPSIVAGVTCAIPLLVFGFSLLVTRTFNDRYVVAAGLGVALVIARRVARHRHGAVIACVLLLLPIANLAARRGETRAWLASAQEIVRDAPGDLPIVMGTGLRFFELREGDPALARRLVFLTVPALVHSPDPTNDHQVQRWGRIRPDLPVHEAEGFLAGRDAFLMFSDPSSTDLLPDYLAGRGFTVETLRQQNTARLVRVTCPVHRGC